jgi:hypothetical protein
MSIWYPSSGISYSQYLQVNSFTKDITGQIRSCVKTSVSDQTKTIIANSQQLSQEFGRGFDSVNNTLNLGFNRLDDVLQDVNISIESLHADFNYSMGLLLEEAQIHNKLLTLLVDRLDMMQKTLEKPLLTQSRELYHIGCERLSKGLLDKALDAFLQAEKKNDADFFTQFHLGKLYLYGINEDDSVLDLYKAKKHLLLAARYAKAEIPNDASFGRFAAESFFHASISVFAQSGNKDVIDDKVKFRQLLNEANNLASESLKYNSNLSEAYYHSAKYFALLDEADKAISNLSKAIRLDRNYTIKVDIDRAFDPVRSDVNEYLMKLKETKKNQVQEELKRVINLKSDVSQWHPEQSSAFSSMFAVNIKKIDRIEEAQANETYFGILDKELLLNEIMTSLSKLKINRIKELRELISWEIEMAINNLRRFGVNSINQDINEARNLINISKLKLNQESFAEFESALFFAQSANSKIKNIEDEFRKEYNAKRFLEEKQKEEQSKKEDSEFKFKEDTSSLASIGGVIGAMIFGVQGCASCTMNIRGDRFWSDWNFFTGLIVGAIAGAIIGYFLGAFVSFFRK